MQTEQVLVVMTPEEELNVRMCQAVYSTDREYYDLFEQNQDARHTVIHEQKIAAYQAAITLAEIDAAEAIAWIV